jgi:hypothetical protein
MSETKGTPVRRAVPFLLLALASSSAGLGQEPPDTNNDESKVSKYELPGLCNQLPERRLVIRRKLEQAGDVLSGDL